MNILYLTITKINNIEDRGLYTDLIRELMKKNHNVYLVSPLEKRLNKPTEFSSQTKLKHLKVKTGNITKTNNLIEKGISTLSIEYYYKKAIMKYFPNEKFDLIIYSTPPITFTNLVRKLKKQHNAKTYLMLKDIFPQNAVDLDMMVNNGFLYNYFRYKEKRLYEISDHIGCMSNANVEYVKKMNPGIDFSKLEVFPNAVRPIPNKVLSDHEIKQIRSCYDIPFNKTIFIYGGNLGKPQGIDFIIKVINEFDKVENGYLLIVGSGTEFLKVKEGVESKKLLNVKLMEKLEKEEYDRLIKAVDIGLIFLDNRFTIPNFPSRITSYLENGLPIIASTDKNTDIGDIVVNNCAGFWCESKDVNKFINISNTLATNEELRIKMGKNGRKLLERDYDISKTINTLLKHI